MVRDFSEEKREELLGYIASSDKKNEDRFCGGVIDWCADIIHYHDLDISDYSTNLSTYQAKVLDKEDTSKEELNTLFDNVIQCDSDYSSKFNERVDLLDALNLALGQLESLINVHSVNPKESSVFLNPATFQNLCDIAEKDMLDAMIENYRKLNDDGTVTYDWEDIKDTLQKDASDVSNLEYLALEEVLESMIHKADDGTYQMDKDNLEKFIECAYAYDIENTSNSAFSGDLIATATWTKNGRLTETYKNLVDIYQEKVSLLVKNLGNVYYDDVSSYEDVYESYINSELYLSNILNITKNEMDWVTIVHSGINDSGYNKVVDEELDITITYNSDIPGSYTVGVSNGNIQDFPNKTGGTAFGYLTDVTVVTHDTINGIGSSMKKDQTEEFVISLGEEACSLGLDKVIDGIETGLELGETATGVVGVVTEIGSFAYDSYDQYIEIEEDNNNLDELMRQNDWGYYTNAFSIGCSVSVNSDNYVDISSIYINKKGLQLKIDAYNAYEGKNLTVDEVVKDIDQFINGEELSSDADRFADWVTHNSENITIYAKDHSK